MKKIVKECMNNERKEKIDDAVESCQKIVDNIQKAYKKIEGLTSQIIDKLDIKNTLLFCNPRTEAGRRYF